MSADLPGYCLDQVRRGDRDRYLTLLFAPKAARGDLAALAAFNLELARARDQVSEPLLGLIRLQWWREAIEEIRSGGKVRLHPVATALAEATRRCGLDTSLMLAMIEAREVEFEAESAPPESEFRARAEATAGNLLHLSLQVLRLDAAKPSLAQAVSQVARAYATVGLARSVLIDAGRRRIRLPRERVAAAGVDLDRLFDLKPQAELATCLRTLGEEAESDLALARGARLSRSAKPVTVTARIAALHLSRLRRVGFDPFNPDFAAAHPMDVWRLLWTGLSGSF